jgi:hypothetical protein
MELICDYERRVAFVKEYNDSVWIEGNAGVRIPQAKQWTYFAYCRTEYI